MNYIFWQTSYYSIEQIYDNNESTPYGFAMTTTGWTMFAHFESYPMPCMNGLLWCRVKAHFFSIQDYLKGYKKVLLRLEKTAFSMVSGHLQ